MGGHIATRAAQLRSEYERHGIVETSFTGIRFLARTLLPEPHATRFRYRTELIQTALFPKWNPVLPPTQRLRIALSGYEERQYLPYAFDRGTDPKPYLSDLQRKCARTVNDDPGILQNKNRFHDHLVEHGFGHRRPRRLGIIEAGEFISAEARSIEDVLLREGTIVVKEEVGGGGNRVYLCESHPDGMRIRGDDHVVEPARYFAGLDRSIVTEYCSQAEYLDRLYPGAPNTLRIITMRRDDGSVFIPAAVQRIGTEAAGVLDNFSQGGISALIEDESGTLSTGAQIDDNLRVRRVRNHPDTGVKIEGFEIPEWIRIREEIRAIAEALPELQYVGWDLLVTEPGEFVIVEGNHFPNPRMIQIHQPLLTDPRVREFFAGTAVPIPAG